MTRCTGNRPGDDARPRPGRRRLLEAALSLPVTAGAGLVLGGCANPAGIPPPPGSQPLQIPVPRLGDRWRYRLIDRYRSAPIGEVAVAVTQAAPQIIARFDASDGDAPRQERWERPGEILEDPVYDVPVRFEDPVPIVPLGARSGLSLHRRTHYRTPLGADRLRWEQVLRVVGWERITVPAGAFEVLRIERDIWLQHPDPFRLGGERTDVLWFSPQVGRWVAREWTGTYMPGSPAPRSGRANEAWTRWELTGWSRPETAR